MLDDTKKVSVVAIDKNAVDQFYEEWNKVSKECNDMIKKAVLDLNKMMGLK